MPTSLKILLIQQSKTLALNIEPQILDDVWDGLQLDPYIKYLICRNADGFYDFEAGGPPSPAGTATSQTLVQSYFVGVRGSYMLTWSFVPETRSISAILIGRPALLSEAEAMIHTYKDCLGHPLTLGLVCTGLLTETSMWRSAKSYPPSWMSSCAQDTVRRL